MTVADSDTDPAAGPPPEKTVRQALRGLRRNADFRRLWVGGAISEAGSSISGLAFPLLTLAMTGSALDAGVVATVGFLANLLGQVPAGHLADTVDRKRLLVAADLTRAALLVVLSAMALTGWYNTVAMLVLTATSTIAWALCGPAQVQALRAVVSRDELAEAAALSQGRSYAVELVTPTAGGLFFTLHRALPFVTDALSFVISAICTARIRTPLGPDRGRPRPRFAPSFARGWKTLWSNRFLRSATLFSAVTNLVVSTLVYVVLLGGGATDGAALGLGVTVTAAAAAGLLGSAVAPFLQRRMMLHHVLATSCAFRAAVLIPALLVDNQALRAVALVAVVFSSPVAGAALYAARILHTPEDVLGRVTGASGIVATCTQPLAPLLAGLVVDTAGSRTAAGWLTIGFAAMSVSVLVSPSLRVRAAA